MVTQKMSDRKYSTSTHSKRITMMHFIVSKEQITYLKHCLYDESLQPTLHMCIHIAIYT